MLVSSFLDFSGLFHCSIIKVPLHQSCKLPCFYQLLFAADKKIFYHRTFIMSTTFLFFRHLFFHYDLFDVEKFLIYSVLVAPHQKRQGLLYYISRMMSSINCINFLFNLYYLIIMVLMYVLIIDYMSYIIKNLKRISAIPYSSYIIHASSATEIHLTTFTDGSQV